MSLDSNTPVFIESSCLVAATGSASGGSMFLLSTCQRGFLTLVVSSPVLVEDADEVVLSAAEARALVAGDPDVLKRVKLASDITRLEVLRGAHIDGLVKARWQLEALPVTIRDLTDKLGQIEADIVRSGPTPKADQFAIAIDGRTYLERPEAVAPMVTAIERGVEQSTNDGNGTIAIASYRSFDVAVRPLNPTNIRLAVHNPERIVMLDHVASSPLERDQLSTYGVGLFHRLAYPFSQFDLERRLTHDALERSKSNLETVRAMLGKPFDHEQELAEMRAEFERINRKLEQRPVVQQAG